ncbi:hypothetical protein FALBO_15577 [Fusarium albosuccineum]|uniref:F-box domain-containing protein n=1 Tax=Fusarium albosuccineum TaxID=1237068 RepID=A0A8H4KT50_9HYPO|nr:hypothetical protein FALBO_15577 [Fusarium albosuccineum]
MDAQHTPPRFQDLPFDVHFEMAKRMDYLSLLRLASTNRFFHRVLDPRAILDKPAMDDFFLDRERHYLEIGAELFACYNCYRFLPKTKFIKRRSFYRAKQPNRFCLDCAAKLKVYDHLKPVASAYIKELHYYFCHNCCRYQTESTKCQGNLIGKDSTDEEIAEALSLCTKSSRQPQRWEKLPAHVWANVSSYLDYRDVIRLAQVSRTMNDTVKPTAWVPLPVRYRFVRDQWALDHQNVHTPDTYPCFMCSRLRPEIRFTQIQLGLVASHPQTAWMMSCESCVNLMGWSKRSLTRIEHRRREMCEICKCIKHVRKPCGGCMELYVKGAIDRRTAYRDEEVNCEENLNRFDGVFDGEDWPHGTHDMTQQGFQ